MMHKPKHKKVSKLEPKKNRGHMQIIELENISNT